MKPSPIQLLQLFFQKVSVELDEQHAPEVPPNPLTNFYSFEGVTLKTGVGIAEMEGPTNDDHVFQLTFELKAENAEIADSKSQRYSPYLLDLRAVALIRVPALARKLGPARDLALVNGAALIWSAMREQVATVSARMPLGQVMLPTVHFQDLLSPEAIAMSAKSATRAQKPAKASKSVSATES